ncbi:hypothetical protein QTG54_010074 [Skeletonema marinoi]|uniref:Protein kinase domain-containing protein n=1 Tax=Skeletonema marinoi TaxID=267567 RepID=A0AAD8Y6D9_9STRA|nr:hypothetical protein QTG54_010074 [Skeletonema marinoi]
MNRFRTPFQRRNNDVNNNGLQRPQKKCNRYCIKGATLCIFVSLMVRSFSLSRHLHNSPQSQYIRSKEKRNSNLSSRQERKPRVVAIAHLQYESSKSESDPRSVLVHNSNLLTLDTTPLDTNKTSFQFTESSIPTSGHFIQPSWYTPNAQDLLRDNDRCEVMYPWQLEGFPNCNNFHELDMAHMKMINKGGSRIAFELKQLSDDGMQSKFVYKTVKYHREVEFRMVDEQRKDALVMERASSSNFIPNLHGYCSIGVIMDFMPEGNMHDYLKGARLAKKKGEDGSLSPVDKLRVAIHIASSVRDLHETGDDKEIPAFFHNDICCHQYLFQNGIFKLNDFNYAQPMAFVKKDTTEKENELCLRDSSNMGMWKARSFEEHLAKSNDARLEPFSGDKTDVNMMGNLMYTILTDLYLFEQPELLTRSQTTEALVAGKRSPYPDDIENSTDPAHVAVKKAIDMCWEEKWNKRPSARIITDYLMGQLQDITKVNNPDLKVTLPKRDPDQTPSDREYYVKTWN